MKKILIALMMAPMALAFEANAAPTAAPVNNTPTEMHDTSAQPAQWRRGRGRRHRVRRCSSYHRQCTRIRTPIGRIVIGNCHRVCRRWGWGWGWHSNMETQALNMTMAQPTAADLSAKNNLDLDATTAIVNAVNEARMGFNDAFESMEVSPDDIAAIKAGSMPSAAAIEQLSQTFASDSGAMTSLLKDLM